MCSVLISAAKRVAVVCSSQIRARSLHRSTFPMRCLVSFSSRRSWKLWVLSPIRFSFHPTLTRVWSLKGRRGQRLVEAPGDNRKVYGFGLVDWRDGWFDGRIATGRTADVFCEQLRAAVARSKERGRVAIVITDNLKTHTPQGSLLVRSMLTELSDQLHLVYTPPYDQQPNRIQYPFLLPPPIPTLNHHPRA